MLTPNELWNSDDEAEWHTALACYNNFIKSSTIVSLDAELDPLDLSVIQQFDAVSWYNFLHDKYFPWKYTAPNRLATTRNQLGRYISEGRIQELHDIKNDLLGFDRADIKKGLEIAQSIHGLGIAGASGLLALMFPEDFGTVDEFLVLALAEIPRLPEAAQLSGLRERINRTKIDKSKSFSLSIGNGVMLIEIMRRKAKENNRLFKGDFWTPRQIDKVLWALGHGDKNSMQVSVRKHCADENTVQKPRVTIVTGKIRRLGQFYKDGVESVSIEVLKSDAAGLPYEIGLRVPVTLIVGGIPYQAGLRATKRNLTVWICPDLYDNSGDKVRLPDVLTNYRPNRPVDIEVHGKTLTIL